MPDSTVVPFPETASGGPGVPPHLWDSERAKAAEITPFDELRRRFGIDYGAARNYAITLKRQHTGAEMEVLRRKAEIGGIATYLLLVAEHGTKADVYKDLGYDRSTLKRYQDLFDYFSWAHPAIEKEVRQRESEGRDTGPVLTIENVISVGQKAAKEAGASKRKKRSAYFSGDPKVWLIDPYGKTVDQIEVPAVFPGLKSGPHWAKQDIGSTGDFQLWVEQNTGRSAYFEFVDLPFPGSSKLNMALRDRAILLRADSERKLTAFTFKDGGLKYVHFDAREPKSVEVISIDPQMGKITQANIMDNGLVISPDDYKVTPIDYSPLNGLALLETDPGDLFIFKVGEQEFRGRSFIARMDDDQWLAPLKIAMSIGDLKQHVSFTTLEAAMAANRQKMPVDEFDGYEVIGGDERMLLLLGMSTADANLIMRDAGLNDPAKASEAGYVKMKDGKRLFHIEKMRALANGVKAQWSQAKTDGFVEAEAADMGAEHWSELHDLTAKGLGVHRDRGFQALQDQGYLRIIAEKRFYHVARVKELLAKAKASDGERPVQPVESPPAIDGPTPERWNTVQAPVGPVQPVEVVQETVQPDQETDQETVEAVQPFASQPVEAQPEEEVEPEISYAAMGYADRELADRKLIDDLNGRLDMIQRRLIGHATQLRGTGDPVVDKLIDDLTAIAEIAEKAHAPVAALADHLDVLKSKSTSSTSPEDLAALYVDTPEETGRQVALPAIITRAYLRNKAGVDTTILGRSGDHRSSTVVH